MKLVDLASLSVTHKEIARFWSRVDRSGGPEACWEWKGPFYRTGYGRFWICRPGSVSPVLPHRLAFFLANGINPGVAFVCHGCDNKRCANPAHLSLGSRSDNVRDAITRGLKPPSWGVSRGESNGFAKLTGETVSAIRQRYAAGGTTARKLGKEYGIAKSHVLRIIHREVWDHLHDGRERREFPNQGKSS